VTTRQVSSLNPGIAASCHPTSADTLTSELRQHNGIMPMATRAVNKVHPLLGIARYNIPSWSNANVSS
jgi:hypothetical protein